MIPETLVRDILPIENGLYEKRVVILKSLVHDIFPFENGLYEVRR